MITIVCSSQYPLDEFKKHVIKTSGLYDKIEFLGYENKGEFSLTEIYNRGLKEAKYKHVVFLHHDISIDTKQWGHKLLKLFEKNPEYGILGVAGTKYVPASGKWWENPKKMYGRVAHTHEGKTWLSSYSGDLGQDIEETVVVDGVFFAVDKTKLKKTFNESVTGFHFYELTLCFENYLEGVKIGVSTVVRINHKSIGMTNEEWEKNRLRFSDRFKDNLPANIKKVLRKGEKLKVLLGCLSFTNYTGSELYVFELAKQLINNGCEVSICSNIGNPLSSAATQLGIKLYTIQEPPGFKLGDGKWLLKTAEGDMVSQPNTLYKLLDINFDVIHLSHKPVIEHLIRLYPDVPVISSIHSEIIDLEYPVIHPMIKKYIAIRPEIKNFMVDVVGIDESLISVIYNPIDDTKFKPTPIVKKAKKMILFVGTMDYLRQNAIIDLINQAKGINHDVCLVGKNNGIDMAEILKGNDHVKVFPPTWNVEKFIQQADITAGIMLGRTTIESWMCNRPSWIYDVDKNGRVLGKTFYPVPEDMEKYKSSNVSKQIMTCYLEILQ